MLAVSGAMLAWTFLNGFTGGAAVSGFIATLAGVGTLVLDIVKWLAEPPAAEPAAAEQADDLARTLYDQWVEEAHARRLRDPGVLPLTWSATERPVTDDPAEVIAGPVTGPVRLRLQGGVDGELDEATSHIAAEYRKIPSGRLVMLGEPGSGKSVLAILLTIGLLADRAPGAAVPVLLSAASWDPTAGGLDEWIVQTVARSYYQGQSDVPDRLLRHGLLLPIIDGLDEILESARRTAVEHVTRATGSHRPVVLTCRAREYEDLITGGAPVLRRAPTVEVAPVAAEDLIAHFAGIDWPHGTDWAPVFAELRRDRTAPVPAALTTPLMVSFARIVYQRLPDAPAELLDRDRFGSRHAVEDHLADKVVDAAYAPTTGPDGPDHPTWNAADARRWLTYLAVYLHRNHERDLAWWMLSQRLLSRWWAPAIGVASGAAVLIVISAWVARFDPSGAIGLNTTMWYGSMISAGFGAIVTVTWYAAAGRPPGRLSLATRDTGARLRSGFRIGVAAVAIPAGPVLLFMAAAISLGVGWSIDAIDTYAEFAGAAIALATCVGGALAVHGWLEAPPVHSASTGPQEQMDQDRALSWWGATAVVAVIGLFGLPAAAIGSGIGSLLFQTASNWSDWPGRVAVWELFRARYRDLTDLRFPNPAITFGAAVLLPAALIALIMLLTRAWPRFVLTHTWLAARGHLPSDLLGFLADARQREILRQRGGVYQFRHIWLQEQLATRQDLRDPADRDPAATPSLWRRGRAALAAATALVVVTAVAGLLAVPEDASVARFTTGYGEGAALLYPEKSGALVAAFANRSSTVHVYDVGGRREIATLPGNAGGIRWVAFAPGGDVVAVLAGARTPETSDDAVRLWSLRDRHATKPLATIQSPSVEHTFISFNSTGDAAYVETRETDGRFIGGWLWYGGAVVLSFTRAAGVTDLAPSPDLASVLTRDNKNVLQLWSAATPGDPLDSWPMPIFWDFHNRFSADGRKVLAPKSVGNSREFWLYDTTAKDRGARLDCNDAQLVGPQKLVLCSHGDNAPAPSLAFRDSSGATIQETSGFEASAEGSMLIVYKSQRLDAVEVWNLDEVRKVADISPGNVDVSEDSSTILVLPSRIGPPEAEERYQLLDGRTGAKLAEITGNYRLPNTRFSAANPILQSQADPDRLFLWNRWLRQPVEMESYSATNTPVYGPNGYLMADEGRDGRIRVRDLVTGRTLVTVINPIRALKQQVTFSADGQSFVTYRAPDSIQLQSRCHPTGIVVDKLSKTYYNAIFSKHGRLLATAAGDGTVALWDAASGRRLRTLVGHGEPVAGMVFTADDAGLVTSAADSTVRVWDLSDLAEQYRHDAVGGPC